MSGLEELKKKLTPLFAAEKGFSSESTSDPNDSYMVSFPHEVRAECSLGFLLKHFLGL